MKKNVLFLCTLLLLVVIGCNDDDNTGSDNGAVAFVNPSVNLSPNENTVLIVFSEETKSSGTVTLNVVPTNAVYGTDFTTAPAITGTTLVVPFNEGTTSTSFAFTSLSAVTEGQIQNVAFTIASISLSGVAIPDATKTTQLNFNETPITTNTAVPTIGGANVPNQVYFDLSSGNGTAVSRTAWDLGFYSGTEFRVAINGSLKMAVKQLATTDMTQPVAIDNTVNVGEGGGSGVLNGDIAYVDGPNGDINGTAIAAVSATDSENKVYLVNMGFNLTNVAPAAGSVNPYGDARGWRKIRILRSGADYKLQYAAIDATTFSEITISKNSAYNFSFFSFNTNTVVSAEPEKAKWDINFTPFTNHTNFGAGFVSYPFQDFIVSNRKGGTRIYQVLNSGGVLFNDFALANVVTANFDLDAAIDQRAIGSNWRNGGGPGTLPSVKDDRFYIVKDVAGNVYKLRFISMTNLAGERGNVSFEYKLLQ